MSDDIRSLSDEKLLETCDRMMRRDREHMAAFLRHLAEVDDRKLWARMGYGSLFDFCLGRWNMSNGEAGNRIHAARAARRFPVVFGMIARGELHLTGVNRLAPHLTDENHREVLAEARRKSVREIDWLVARVAPEPDRKSMMRRVHTPASKATAGADTSREPAPAPERTPTPDANGPQQGLGLGMTAQRRRGPEPKPLSPGRVWLGATISEECATQIDQIVGLLAHQFPDRDRGRVIEMAVPMLLEQLLKKAGPAAEGRGVQNGQTPKACWPRLQITKAALTDEPRPRRREGDGATEEASDKRYIPAEVRRAVWERDQGKCAFVGVDGRVCGSEDRVQYGHLEPWAKGGKHTVDNVALRCHAHNAYEAERDYGKELIARKKRERRRRRAHGGRPGPDQVREAMARYGPVARLGAHLPEDIHGPYSSGWARWCPQELSVRPGVRARSGGGAEPLVAGRA